jgi:hypothetical protein
MPTATTLTIGAGSACSSGTSGHISMPPVGTQASLQDSKSSGWHGGADIPMCAGALMCGCLAIWRRNIRLHLVLAIAAMALAGAGLTGCGGGSSSGSTSGSSTTNTTPTKTSYVLVLKGSDSVSTGITASTTFNLTVD